MIVADTSVLVDHLRGRTEARVALAGAAADGIAASVLTKTELLAGMRSAERGTVQRLFGALTWLPVSDEVAQQAGEYGRAYRASHSAIDVVDFVIAATARHLGADLWTRNVRHFPMFPGLTSPY